MEDLQHPLLKVPIQCMTQRFRRFHKVLTREVAAMGESVRSYCREQSTAETAAATQTLERLTALAAKIQTAKQQVETFASAQEMDVESCVRRAEFLKKQHQVAANEESSAETSAGEAKGGEEAAKVVDTDKGTAATGTSDEHIVLQQWIADYLLSQGYMQTSTLVEQQHGIEYLVDHALQAERLKIVKALEQHDATMAIEWCCDNASQLRRMQSTMEFQLRLQVFLELVRVDKKLEAIQYAQLHLAPLSLQQNDSTIKKNMMDSIQEAMATLAFAAPDTCGIETYVRLFAPERWQNLTTMFHKTFCSAYGLHDPSALFLALFTGLSTLNTRACQRKRKARALRDIYLHEDHEDGDENEEATAPSRKKSRTTSPDTEVSDSTQKRSSRPYRDEVSLCPTCSIACTPLCDSLPIAPHPHSHLLCRVTHEVMDEHNPPIALPNGHVYSRRVIESMTHGEGKASVITCPMTQEVFTLADTKPVSIL